MADDKNFSVIASNVITVDKRVKELWFDVIPTSEEKLLEGCGCGLQVRSCIASVRPLESAGKPQQVDGVPIHPINFSLLLPTLCWCAAATAVVNHVTLTLHDIRTRLRRGQAGWERTSALKDSKAPNPFTTLLQLSPDQFHQDVISYITQPVAGMSSGRVSVKDPKQVAQMHFRLNTRHFALLSSDCMNCIYDVENGTEVGSGNESGVSTASSAAVASQAKKIAIATLKDVINIGHPKFGHYIPSCTPLLVSTAQSGMYDVPSYSGLLFHKHDKATVERIRWMHYDRLIKMLSGVVGQPQADQLFGEGVGKHGRRIKASYREHYVLGKTPPKSAESDQDDAEQNDGDNEITTARPPPVVTGAKRERAHNELGIEEYVDVDEEDDGVSSPAVASGGGMAVAQSIRDLPFDVKMDWSPLLASNITDTVYQASVDAVITNTTNPDEITKHLIQASNGGGGSSSVGPQQVFDAKVSRKPLSCIGVVADIQRTLLESSNLLGITKFISSPLYKVNPHAPLMVSGILEARHPMDDPLHPLAHYIAFSGTASPVSSSCGVKHSHRPSRIMDINVAAGTREFMKSSNKERFTELHERLSIFTDLVKRKLEQFEGVMQCIGSSMRPARNQNGPSTTTAASSAASSSVGWMSLVVEALPYHPYAIPAHPTQRTLHIEAKNMSVDAAQEVLHWVQRNHFVATILQSLVFHAEEWAIQLRIALREGQELDALKSG